MFPKASVLRVSAAVGLALAATPPSGAQPFKLTGWDAAAVERAVEGAARRLADEACQAVLDEFHHLQGERLRDTLEEPTSIETTRRVDSRRR